ncbi:MAG: hypothetical protein AAGG81_03370 [Chlamydiota bacterium]
MIANIFYDMPHRTEWEVPPLSEIESSELQRIFNQKYSYIGKGAQSYVFGSEDGKYVIKFFKYKHLKPSWLVQNLPGIGPIKTYKEKVTARKQQKLDSVFGGYHLAYEVHKKESGLLYIHLNRGSDLNTKVTIIDKLGFEREVDLDSVNFIVQERVDTSRKAIYTALLEGNIQQAKTYVNSLLNLYLSEYAKGIYDYDHGVLHNTGFVGERPVHLDVGKLYRDENIHKPEYAQKDLAFVIAKISKRISERFPALHQELGDSMHAFVNEMFEQPSDHLLESCYYR